MSSGILRWTDVVYPYTQPGTDGSENGNMQKRPQPIMAETDSEQTLRVRSTVAAEVVNQFAKTICIWRN